MSIIVFLLKNKIYIKNNNNIIIIKGNKINSLYYLNIIPNNKEKIFTLIDAINNESHLGYPKPHSGYPKQNNIIVNNKINKNTNKTQNNNKVLNKDLNNDKNPNKDLKLNKTFNKNLINKFDLY
jgi:hypothetical protein